MGFGNTTIKDVTLIAICAAILFVQQLVLSFLPNIQFTTLLVILFTKVLGFKKTTLIIVIHVMVINILSPYGPLMPIYIPSMFIGWMLIPIGLTTIFKKLNSAYALAIFGFFFGFVYGWLYIPVAVLVLGTPFEAYFMMDLPFELIMALSNFLTVLWLYDPLSKMLVKEKEKYYQIV